MPVKSPVKPHHFSLSHWKREWREPIHESRKIPNWLKHVLVTKDADKDPVTTKEHFSLKNLFTAMVMPWRASGRAFVTTWGIFYVLTNTTALFTPGVDNALARYELTRDDLPTNAKGKPDLPPRNLRFRFGGEASSLQALTDGPFLLMNAFNYLGSARPAGDYAVSASFTYRWLNNHTTGLCTVTSKTTPEMAHQAFAAIAGIDPEYAAFLIKGREKAFALYIMLHEIRHCSPENAKFEGSAREADSDVWALNVMRHIEKLHPGKYPNIEDLVMLGRAHGFNYEHDTSLNVAAYLQHKPMHSKDEIEDAAKLMNDWARPYANKYASIVLNDPHKGFWEGMGTWFKQTIFALAPDQEPSLQAYLKAWNDHKGKPLKPADQNAFDRLEMMLGSLQVLNHEKFAFYESNTGVNFVPQSAGRFARLQAQIVTQKAVLTPPPAKDTLAGPH